VLELIGFILDYLSLYFVAVKYEMWNVMPLKPPSSKIKVILSSAYFSEYMPPNP
jgi:hypothetical protein